MTPGKKPKKLFTDINQIKVNFEQLGISAEEQEKILIYVDDAFEKLTRGNYCYYDFYYLIENVFIYLSNSDMFKNKPPHKYLTEKASTFSFTCFESLGYFFPLLQFIFNDNLQSNNGYDRELALKRYAAFCEVLARKAQLYLEQNRKFDSIYGLLVTVLLAFSGSFNYDAFVKSISKCPDHTDREKVNLYITTFTELEKSPKCLAYSYMLAVCFRVLKKLEKLFCEKVKDQL